MKSLVYISRAAVLSVCLSLALGSACSRAFPDDELAVLSTLMLANPAAPGTESRASAQPKVFLSAAQPSGNLGGVAGADALCNSDGNRPDSAPYRAMLVDGTNRRACVNASCTPTAPGDGLDWVFAANTSYYRADGGGTLTEVLRTDSNRIASFPLLANGFTSSAANEYWTGLEVDWTVANAGPDLDCTDWTGVGSAQVGIGGAATTDAISFGTPACFLAGTYHLLCVEQ